MAVYSTQPQLLQIALDKKDVVYTPDWVARDMVTFFKPSGRILEPCAGDGAFLKYLPGADWCEIEKGRDFFACHGHYDWIIGNPPYKQYTEFIEYSFCIGDNVLFFLPASKPFTSMRRAKKISEYGGLVHMRYITDGSSINFPLGFPMAAFHFQRGYTGPMETTFYQGETL